METHLQQLYIILLLIICASFPGSEDFVCLNLWYKNSILFISVSCDIWFFFFFASFRWKQLQTETFEGITLSASETQGCIILCTSVNRLHWCICVQYVSGRKLFVCAGFFCCTFAFGHFDHNKPNLYEQCVDKLLHIGVIYFIR